MTEEEIISSISEFAKNGKIILDLDQILGEGGEGLVVEQELIFMEKPQMCAVKFINYEKYLTIELQTGRQSQFIL